MGDGMDFRRYDELPFLEGTEERVAWDVFGREDEAGTGNFITPAATLAALRGVREGTVVNLNLPVGEPPSPFWGGERRQTSRTEFGTRTGRDDKLDDFYPQGGTQWDGLRHVRFQRTRQYYGGRTDEDL